MNKETKICNICNIEKSILKFSKDCIKILKNGEKKFYIRLTCIECRYKSSSKHQKFLKKQELEKNNIHICRVCKLSEPDVIFGIQKRKNKQSFYIRKVCNFCRFHDEIGKHLTEPEYKEKLKIKRTDLALRKNYNITLEHRNNILIKQNYNCAICNDSTKELVVDHNHISGEVRGLLCWTCNAGLGCYKDNIEYMLKAIEYLKKPVTIR